MVLKVFIFFHRGLLFHSAYISNFIANNFKYIKLSPFQCVLMSQVVGGGSSLILLADCPLEWIVCFTLDFNFLLRVCFSSSWIMEVSLHSCSVSVEDVIIVKSDCILNVAQAKDLFFMIPTQSTGRKCPSSLLPCPFLFSLGIQPFTRPCSAW